MIKIRFDSNKLKLPGFIQAKIDAWAKKLARSFPRLKSDLTQANMDMTVESFVSKTIVLSLFLSAGLTLLSIIIIGIMGLTPFFLVLIIPGILIVSFFYLLQVPKARTRKVQRDIDKEIVYAGRFLLIELTAGVPLYDALNNVAKSYKKVGKYFYSITRKIESGTTMEEALDDVIAETPSENFRKLLWQVNNSLRTGSDINNSLQSIIEQISREQMIQVQDYARKLNPMVMFYLMLAIIVPSLGITMLSLLSTFIQLNISLGLLIGLALLIGIIQFGFFSSIRLSRPGVEI